MILFCDKSAQIESGGIEICGSKIFEILFLDEYKICGSKEEYSWLNWYKKLISRGCKNVVGSWISKTLFVV